MGFWYTAVPEPDQVDAYIETALEGQREGHMWPWVVRDLATGEIVGRTRYHDIVAPIDRVEIGYTWYAAKLPADAREHDVQARCCSSTRSRHSAARSSGSAPTTSTSRHSVRSSGSARRRTV